MTSKWMVVARLGETKKNSMGTLDLDPMQAWVRLFNEVIYYFLKLLHKYQNY